MTRQNSERANKSVGSKKSFLFFYNMKFYSIQGSKAFQGRSLKLVIMSEVYDMNELRNEDYEDYDDLPMT